MNGSIVRPGDLLPGRDAPLQLADRDERVDAHLVVVVAADEVVDDADVVAALRQVQRRGPTEIAVPAEYQDPHRALDLPSLSFRASGR